MPDDRQRAFKDALLSYLIWLEGSSDEPKVRYQGELISITRLCSLLWRCTETLPPDLLQLARRAESPFYPMRRGTYAAAARMLKRQMANRMDIIALFAGPPLTKEECDADIIALFPF